MPNPTKILQYDLDMSLSKVFDELEKLKTDMHQTSLYDLFSNINVDMLSDKEALIIKDLMDGYEKSQKLTIQRIKEIELLLQAGLEDGQDGTEKYEYEPEFNNVVKETFKDVNGKVVYEISYDYVDLESGKLNYSEKKFTDQDGNSVSIKKTYTYNANDDISDIVTQTTVTPA